MLHELHKLVVGRVRGQQRARRVQVRVQRVHVAQLPVALAGAAQKEQEFADLFPKEKLQNIVMIKIMTYFITYKSIVD